MSLVDLLKQHTGNTESLTLKYVPFILNKVRAKYAKHVGIYKYDALLEVAIEASLKAEKRFDSTRGTDFSTYARHYIDGDLDAYVSSMTKHQIDIHKKILDFINTYTKTNGTFPTENKICRAIGMSFEKYREFLKELEPVTVVSYNYVTDSGREEEYGIDEYNPESSILSLDIFKLLDTMPKEQATIVKMVCVDEMSIHSVMAYLRVDRNKAQQRIDKAIDSFRAILEENGIKG